MALPNHVTIWLANLDELPMEQVAEWVGLLSASEQQRYRAFIRAERQRQFVAGRMLLRHASAVEAGADAAAIRVEEQLGKPPVVTVEGAKRAPFFSIAHSRSWLACAVSAGCAVGLDIEVPDPARDIAAAAAQAFGVTEAHRLMALPDEEKLAEFYGLWCRAEASFKLGQTAAACYAVAHEAVAIAVCTTHPLSAAPGLKLVESLPALFDA